MIRSPLCLTFIRNIVPFFSLPPNELGRCTIAEATFPSKPGTRPVERNFYRTSPLVQETIDQQVDELLEQNIFEERTSAWGSPVTIVSKADGSPRFCVDYRHTLNRHLVRKTWPMPNIDTHLDAVGGAKFITVADVQSAFHQLPVAEADIESTAFCHRTRQVLLTLSMSCCTLFFTKTVFVLNECRSEFVMHPGFTNV